MTELKADPRGSNRLRLASQVRDEARRVAEEKFDENLGGNNNGEAEMSPYAASFSKGLTHNRFGLLANPTGTDAFDAFKSEISQPVQRNNQDMQKRNSPFPDRSAGDPITGAVDIYPEGTAAPFKVPHPANGSFHLRKPDGAGGTRAVEWRGWESPLAGHTFDLEGADAGSVSVPPAPVIGSDELTAEMAEMYAMALLRDVPFNEIDGSVPSTTASITGVLDSLNELSWFQKANAPANAREKRRHEARFTEEKTKGLTQSTLFRGSPPGSKKGPYISQFLLIGSLPRGGQAAPMAAVGQTAVESFSGDRAQIQQRVPLPPGLAAGAGPGANAPDGEQSLPPVGGDCPTAEQDPVAQGFIQYGVQFVSQRFVPHRKGIDWMTDWASWLDVQNGADRRGLDRYMPDVAPFGRFIHTPRDLATYVHFDALYQAYLNACLILIGLKAFTDRGLPEGQGAETRAGFATFGDPHILTLVTEVATRSLKAVRRQKYQTHLRARPEAVAGLITLAGSGSASQLDSFEAAARAMFDALPEALRNSVATHNTANNSRTNPPNVEAQDAANTSADNWIAGTQNLLLPIAFPEGSPMHPSYGAGHATVGGACVTVLKAFFEMFALKSTGDWKFERGVTRLDDIIELFESNDWRKLFPDELKMTHRFEGETTPSPIKGTYRTTADGSCIKAFSDQGLTIQGELNKLAANIAIGRNFAGVHYYTDYYESIRLGERVAVSILQEQMLTYREPVSMRFNSFDGDSILLTGSGGSRNRDDAIIHVRNKDGDPIDWEEWWHRGAIEAG